MDKATLAELITALVKLSLFIIMFALGLGLLRQNFLRLWQNPSLVLRSLIAVVILVPLSAICLLKGLPDLPAPTRHAIALMAACPSAPFILRKSSKVGADADIAGPLQLFFALLSILTVPVTIFCFKILFARTGWDVTPETVAPVILQTQILPLGLGFLVRQLSPDWADKLQRPLIKLSNILFPVIILLILVKAAQPLMQFLGSSVVTLVAMMIMVAMALLIGHLSGGPGEKTRTTLALVTSMRNPGLAMLLASKFASDVVFIRAAIAAYVVLTALGSIPYLSWRKRATAPE